MDDFDEHAIKMIRKASISRLLPPVPEDKPTEIKLAINSYNNSFDSSDSTSLIKEVNDTTIKIVEDNVKRLLNLLDRLLYSLDNKDLYFFLNSLYLYEFKKYLDKYFLDGDVSSELIDEIDGSLNISSVNCFNCILDYKTTSKTLNLFIKVVDYKDYDNDLVIFDIINGVFLNMLLMDAELSKFKNFTSIYRYSFLSYYYRYNESKFLWTYNKLLYISNEHYDNTSMSDINSPYNPHVNNQDFYNLLTNNHGLTYYKKAYVVVFDGIEHINIHLLFKIKFLQSRTNFNIIEKIFSEKFKIFFQLLLELGIKYGFHHNDLHGGNIIYRYDTDELAIIDFGRSCFGILLDTNHRNYNRYNQHINPILIKEIDKSNYKHHDLDNKASIFTDKIKLYKDLYEPVHELTLYHCYIKTFDDNKYYMIVFDHITLILEMYYCFILYLHYNLHGTSDYVHFDAFIYYFEELFMYTDNSFKYLFQINKGSTDLDKLINTYNNICKTYINNTILSNSTHPLNQYKDTIKILLDGLLLVALLLLSFNCTDNTQGIIHESNIVTLTIDDKEYFISYLLELYLKYLSYFIDNNHFINDILKVDISESRGGKRKYKRKAGSKNIGISEELSIKKNDSDESRIINPPIEMETIQNKKVKLNECYNKTYKNKEEIRLKQKEIVKPKIPERPERPEISEISELQTLIKGKLKELVVESKEPVQSEKFTGNYNSYIIPGITIIEESEKGGNNKVLTRKIRRLKKYN